jgi:hypothetical protein
VLSCAGWCLAAVSLHEILVFGEVGPFGILC